MGKIIERKKLRTHIIKGISTSHSTYRSLILLLNQNKKMSISTIQRQLSEYDRNVNLNRGEHAAATTDQNNPAPKTPRFNGYCEHCGFYGRETNNFKG